MFCCKRDPNVIYFDVVSPEEVGFELGEKIEISKGDAERYDGTYTVMPSFELQQLQTKYKFLEDDVKIVPIMVSRTTNQTGGNTIYIGGVLNG